MLLQIVAAYIRDMLVNLSMARNPYASHNGLLPALGIKRCLMECLHLLVTLIFLGRSELCYELSVINLATGERVLQPSREQLQWAVVRMGLTQQQLHRLAQAHHTRQALLEPIQRERASLQKHMDVQCEVLDENMASLPIGTQPSLERWQKQCHGKQQQQHLERLQLLLRKEGVIHAACSLYTMGAITPLQVRFQCEAGVCQQSTAVWVRCN